MRIAPNPSRFTARSPPILNVLPAFVSAPSKSPTLITDNPTPPARLNPTNSRRSIFLVILSLYLFLSLSFLIPKELFQGFDPRNDQFRSLPDRYRVPFFQPCDLFLFHLRELRRRQKTL